MNSSATKASPIRVLHTESSPNLGGQELRILTEMERLTALGYTSVLAARTGSAILAEAGRRKLEAYAFPFRGSIDPQSMWGLARLMQRHQIDIVNAHGSKDAWNAALVARMLGIKVIRARHVGNPIKPGKIARLVYGPLCDRIMVTSRAIAAGMVGRGVDATKIDCVPTGIDVEKYSRAESIGTLRRELNVPAGVPIIGMVSILRGDKGPQVFIAAAQRLLARGCKAYFVLVGDGLMRSELEAQAKATVPPECLRLTGYRRDIPQILKEFSLAVVPSTMTDGVPQVILQAFAAGIPVVASDVGGVNEVAHHGKTALCVQAGSDEALACGIEHLLAAPQAAAALAENAFDLVNGPLSQARMLIKMDELYRQVLAQ